MTVLHWTNRPVTTVTTVPVTTVTDKFGEAFWNEIDRQTTSATKKARVEKQKAEGGCSNKNLLQ